MNTGRAGCGACVTKNKLYVFYGWDHTNKNLRSIEYFKIDELDGWNYASY